MGAVFFAACVTETGGGVFAQEPHCNCYANIATI